MKADTRCLPCLKGLAIQAIELATPNPKLRAKVLKETLKILEQNFSTDIIPTLISDEMHARIKKVTGNADPYARLKKREMEVAKELSDEIRQTYGNNLRSCIEHAAIGNTLDFFRDFEQVRKDAQRKPKFAIDDISEFEKHLDRTERILYLADNAGECYFDLPLIKRLRDFARVIYVTKGAPIQNDITLGDLEKSGIRAEIGEVITTGTATVGIDLAKVSPEFKAEFDRADLMVAKGMGHYETLSELPIRGKVFYLLMAKCAPVARSLGIPEGSYVAMLR
jgi:hypothetical protein